MGDSIGGCGCDGIGGGFDVETVDGGGWYGGIEGGGAAIDGDINGPGVATVAGGSGGGGGAGVVVDTCAIGAVTGAGTVVGAAVGVGAEIGLGVCPEEAEGVVVAAVVAFEAGTDAGSVVVVGSVKVPFSSVDIGGSGGVGPATLAVVVIAVAVPDVELGIGAGDAVLGGWSG